MAMSIYLKRAIEAYEDDNSPLTEDEKYMQLGDALMKNITTKLIRLKNEGKAGQISEDDAHFQIECMRFYKELGAMRIQMKKAMKDSGKTEEDWKRQLNHFVQSHVSSMGSIVRDININSEEKKN